jgi:hypothetical protein
VLTTNPVLARYLTALDAQLADLARSAIETPGNGDAFRYGNVCGRYAGVKEARAILLALIDEDTHARRHDDGGHRPGRYD